MNNILTRIREDLISATGKKNSSGTNTLEYVACQNIQMLNKRKKEKKKRNMFCRSTA